MVIDKTRCSFLNLGEKDCNKKQYWVKSSIPDLLYISFHCLEKDVILQAVTCPCPALIERIIKTTKQTEMGTHLLIDTSLRTKYYKNSLQCRTVTAGQPLDFITDP